MYHIVNNKIEQLRTDRVTLHHAFLDSDVNAEDLNHLTLEEVDNNLYAVIRDFTFLYRDLSKELTKFLSVDAVKCF